MKKEEYLKMIKERTTIENKIEKGTYYKEIKDILTISEEEFRKAIDELLSYPVKDDEIRRIIQEEQNINKIKHRFEGIYKIINEKGKPLGEGNAIGKTPNTMRKELKGEMREGEQIDYNMVKKNLGEKGWKTNKIEEGTIGNVNLKIIFRKG